MDVPQIGYAPPPPLYRRKRFRRSITVLVILGFLVFLSWLIGPAAWRRGQMLYWQRQALKWSPPADQIVLDDRPSDRGSLKVSPDLGTVQTSGRTAFVYAKAWDSFYTLWSPPGGVPVPTLFVHERRNAHGPRLVILEQTPAQQALGLFYAVQKPALRPSDIAMIRCRVFALGGAFNAPELRTDVSTFIDPSPESFRHHSCWNAGQSDPKDPSHFTVQCRVGDRVMTIDGWLMDDNTVAIQTR